MTEASFPNLAGVTPSEIGRMTAAKHNQPAPAEGRMSGEPLDGGKRARAQAEQAENDATDALIRRAASGGFDS